MFRICKIISKHNFIQTLLVIAGSILSFHFEMILQMYSSCPIIVAMGKSETGKSTALRAGLSLFACDEIGRFVKGTNSILLERACSSSFPFAIEEGKGSKNKSRTNQMDVSELIIDVSNGSRSTNMKTGTMKPKTVPLIASNFEVDDIERYVVYMGVLNITTTPQAHICQL